MGKFLNALIGKDNDDERDDEYEEEGYEDYGDDGMDAEGGNFGGSASGMLELKVVRPEGYESVTTIADHLLNNRTVVLNLEATSKETSRRLIDFLSGVAYSINGNLKRVANNTFVITPCNVDVSGELAAQEAKVQQEQKKASESEFLGF